MKQPGREASEREIRPVARRATEADHRKFAAASDQKPSAGERGGKRPTRDRRAGRKYLAIGNSLASCRRGKKIVPKKGSRTILKKGREGQKTSQNEAAYRRNLWRQRSERLQTRQAGN